ncbi:hypothetical protein CHUAL_011577 [Chamberlinius hualienensis]
MAVKMMFVYSFSIVIRSILLFNSDKFQWLFKSVFVSTPVSSWKRIEEGIYLQNAGISPYSGDILHEPPLVLLFFEYFKANFPPYFLNWLFVLSDVVTALCLSKIVQLFLLKQADEDRAAAKDCPDASKFAVTPSDAIQLANAAATFYLLSPYSLLCCGAKSTAVISNLIISITLLNMIKGNGILTCLLLSFATYHTFYPVVLLPLALLFLVAQVNCDKKLYLTGYLLLFIVSTVTLLWISYGLMGNWSFISATYGCIFNVNDLTPNIGLFWYFFTEMFDHFRSFFIFIFQLNAVIYSLPLTVTFRKSPLLVVFSLLCLMAIFKSYPSVGDVALYTALLPMLKHLYPFTRHMFVIGCFYVTCSAISPLLYSLWIDYGSANANFFFGATLAFNAAQVFLLTDILFGQLKRQFHMKHGLKPKINGEDARLRLD